MVIMAANGRENAKEGNLVNSLPHGQKPTRPDKLRMLHQALRAWCEEQHSELNSPEALEAARELVIWFDYSLGPSLQSNIPCVVRPTKAR
jgi:hypothetical protein